jgi:hypothetical protein
MIDIIQSYIIRGAIILIIIQAMISLQQTLYERSRKAQLEQEMFQMSSIVCSDLRRIGSDSISVKPYFSIADTSTLQFKIGDSLSFAISHQMYYYLTKSGKKYTLQRSVDGGTALIIGQNLTQFKCTFYDDVGNKLASTPLSSANRLKIKSIAILARMESATSTQDITWSIWQTKIYPQNL